MVTRLARLQLYLAVGLGSALGGLLRFWVSTALNGPQVSGLPLGTLFANVSGSFLIGFYAGLAGIDGGQSAAEAWRRQFFMAGLCGGYTTFSFFSLETLRLLDAGRMETAAAYVTVSLAGWLLAVWGGFALGGCWRRR